MSAEAEKRIQEARSIYANQLDLSGLGIRELPSSVAMLDLRSLNLANNKFDSFPSILYRMVNLRDLDLSMNALNAIPEGLSALKALRSLNFFSHSALVGVYGL